MWVKLIDRQGERNVNVCNAAAVVGGQLELGVAPAECYVWVMIGGLGEGADAVYELQCLGEVWERVAFRQNAGDPVAADLGTDSGPAGEG